MLRQQQRTIQCLVFVSEAVSRQMVKFVARVSKESIVEVQAKVVAVDAKVESCTQQDVELQAEQVGCSISNRIFTEDKNVFMYSLHVFPDVSCFPYISPLV